MIQVLRAKDRVVSPWKNGGGTTTEVAKFPADAGLNDFDWRISIAEIASSGPFSPFLGIDRHLALLKGHIKLEIADRSMVELSPGSSPISFPGDVSTKAELIGDRATDLNVMVRRDALTARMTRRFLSAEIVTDTATTMIFPLASTIVFEGLVAVELAYGDALHIEGLETLRMAAKAECYWIEISRRR